MNAACFASFFALLPAVLGPRRPVPALVEYLTIGGAVILATGAGLVWVLGFRKSRSRRRGRHRPHHRSSESPPGGGTRESRSARPRRGRRHRNYPRNPTLAETGGLPPLRATQPGPKDALTH